MAKQKRVTLERNDPKAARVKAIVDRYAQQCRSGLDPSHEIILSENNDIADTLVRELNRIDLLLSAFNSVDSDGAESSIHDSTPTLNKLTTQVQSKDALQVRCPECQSSVDVKNDTPWTDITCESCDAKFSLVGNASDAELALANLNQFELLERIGMGGYGLVWKFERVMLVEL